VLFRPLRRPRRRPWATDGLVAGPATGRRRRPGQPAGGNDPFRPAPAASDGTDANPRRLVSVGRDAAIGSQATLVCSRIRQNSGWLAVAEFWRIRLQTSVLGLACCTRILANSATGP